MAMYVDMDRVFWGRLKVLLVVLALSALAVGVRLLYLQVSAADMYRTLSDENRFYTRMLTPERGSLYDRHGRVLATNRLEYSVSVIPELIDDRAALLAWLDEIFLGEGYDREQFLKRLQERRMRYSRPVSIADGIGIDNVAKIAEGRHKFPGVKIGARSRRYYPHSEVVAHVVGYTSRPSARDYEQGVDEVQYRHLDRIGRIGLEATYEKTLAGEVGYEVVEVDVRGNVVRRLDVHSPVHGRDVTTALDMDMMRAAHKAMKSRRGAVVGLDVATGEIRTLVSSPGFNSNTLERGDNYAQWLASPDKPLFNRALHAQYPPGSVVKPVVALGGLRQGVLNWEHEIEDTGVFHPSRGQRVYRDWEEDGHGTVDLFKAIYQSCDVYFWTFAESMGVDGVASAMRDFGLGRSLGLGDKPGIVPTPSWKRSKGRPLWMPGDLLNLAVGQGDLLATPLQLAYMTAMLASDTGRVPLPTLVERTAYPMDLSVEADGEAEGHWLNGYKLEDIASVRDAMLRVTARDGTAPRASWGHSYSIAGKTGTAQVVTLSQWDEEGNALKKSDIELAQEHQDHALFIGYAPADKPEIAVVAIVENGGSGGKVASEVVRDVIVAYMRAAEAREQASLAEVGAEVSGDMAGGSR